MTNAVKLAKFIEDNYLTFQDGSRNSDSVKLAGYACYLKFTNVHLILDILNEEVTGFDYDNEFEEVFKYAKSNNYAAFWKTEDAEVEYKFEK